MDGALPARVALGRWPTPAQQLSGPADGPGALWVKREDQSSGLYGGNKLRKLEFILAEALAHGQTQLLTGGAAGSHHVAATALFGAGLGLSVHAVLGPQPDSAHARAMLRLSSATCASLIPVSSARDLPAALLALARRLGAGCLRIPIGGSSPTGLMGSIDLGLEIAEDIEAGRLPSPTQVVLPLGSGGSAVGVWLGLRLAGRRCLVRAIQVSPGPFGRRGRLRGLARAAAALLPQKAPVETHLDGLVIDRSWLGAGYGTLSPQARRAMDHAAEIGLPGIEQTYSARALAAALHHPEDGPRLFIHTANSQPLAPTDSADDSALPARLAALLQALP